MTTQRLLFPLLTVGLEKYLRQDRPYPYPQELQHAMNLLVLELRDAYPTTFAAFLALMEQPPESWYQGDNLPNGLDKRVSLLYRGQLNELTEDYLIAEDLSGLNLETLITHQENMMMQALIETARSQYQQADDDATALKSEADYARTRRFIIENGFTNPMTIRQQIPIRYRELVTEMYQPVAALRDRLLYHDHYWHCEACGPLIFVGANRLQSLKPSACSVRCPGSAGWDRIPPDGDLMVLKPGIHRRTLIPGLAEISLFDWVVELSESNPDQLTNVTLYPGVDRYDIRLVFSDGEVWAIDVKDYRDPLALGKQIGSHPRPFDRDPRLRWSRTYYVVPDYREREHPGYREKAQREARLTRFRDIELVTINHFKRLVETKIWEMN